MPTRREFLGAASLALAGGVAAANDKTPASPPAAAAKYPLRPGAQANSFEFATEAIEGTIRLDGVYHGVSRLVDKQTGRQVIDPRYSALNLYRLFSSNNGLGQPRTMSGTFHAADNFAETTWAPTDIHHAMIQTRYAVTSASSVDAWVTVESKGSYRGYEVFLPSYFDKVLKPHVVLEPARGGKAPEVVVPWANDVFRGCVLVFPRDMHAARHCIDGRWDRSEMKSSTVQMCPVRRYSQCMAFLTDPSEKMAVVVMSRPADAYAISSRYFAEKDADRLTSYSAIDFSLFGDDLIPGSRRTVQVRLAVTPIDSEKSQPLRLYREFLAEPPALPSA